MLMGSLLVLAMFLLGFGLLAEWFIGKYFGLCPKCWKNSVHTTEEDTGPDSSCPDIRHTYVFKECRNCGWCEGSDTKHRHE